MKEANKGDVEGDLSADAPTATVVKKQQQEDGHRGDRDGYDNDDPPPGCELSSGTSSSIQVPGLVRRFPRILEENCFCQTMGSIGLDKWSENRTTRRRVMMTSAVLNAIGFLLTLLSCLAMSTNYSILTAFSFTNGHVQTTFNITTTTTTTNATTGINNNQTWTDIIDRYHDYDFQPATMSLGLRAVATDHIKNLYHWQQQGPAVYTFDEFCDLPQQDSAIFLPPGACQSCLSVSNSLMISITISLLAYIPSMLTSIRRMHHSADINCRKTLAILTMTLSFGMALKTILGYKNNCYNDHYQVQIPRNATTAEGAGIFTTVVFEWTGGAGFFCLVVAMGFKLLELSLHMLLPSPSHARNPHRCQEEQQQDQEEQGVKQQATFIVSEDEQGDQIPAEDDSPCSVERGCLEEGNPAKRM